MKKTKPKSEYETIKIKGRYVDMVRGHKEKTRTPIAAFIEMAIEEKLRREAK